MAKWCYGDMVIWYNIIFLGQAHNNYFFWTYLNTWKQLGALLFQSCSEDSD